jgi:hypothetical protein
MSGFEGKYGNAGRRADETGQAPTESGEDAASEVH